MRATLPRLRKLERQFSPEIVDPSWSFPPCIRAWQRGEGPPPPFRCLYALLWNLFCVQDSPRSMSAARRELAAVDNLLFAAVVAWHPGLPSVDPAADYARIAAGPGAIGWQCLVLNSDTLHRCVARHTHALSFNGDIAVQWGARDVMLAGCVRLLFRHDLTDEEQAAPFLTANPCHPWP